MIRWIASGAVAVVAVGLGATWYVTRIASDDPFGQCRTTSVSGEAQIGGPFELINAKGETVTETDVITEPTIIYFGYTFCPDVCPLDMARNAEAIDVLADNGHSATPVFITVDPKRDTPEVVGDFAYNLHEKMIGLTGSDEQIAAASKAYKTYYKAQPADDDYYLVDHSTFSYLVLPEHGFVEFFRNQLDATNVAQQMACFIENA